MTHPDLDEYFARVLTRLGSGIATPTEQQDMAMRIETLLAKLTLLREELALYPPLKFIAPPLGTPKREWP